MTELILSFDVFDTLLTRYHSSVFCRLKLAYRQIFQDEQTCRAVIDARMRGEAIARDQRGSDLYSLREIYCEMESICGLGAATLDEAHEAELAMEEAQCFAISEGQRLLKEASKNHQVIYVSDMYLPPEFIMNLLEKNDLWILGSQLFVSHAEGCAKHSGLFSKICRELGVAANEIIHYGDNWQSDVLAPRKIGIKAIHFTETAPTRYEKRFAGLGECKMSDAVRAVRLQCPWTAPDHKKVIYETASSVAAPLFIAYVIWLEKEARARGIQRLYFISRDGLIFKKIYDLLFAGKENTPASHYLYGSRQAWTCARLLRLEEEDIQFLIVANPTLSLRQFLDRCGVPLQEMPRIAGIDFVADPDRPLKKEEINAIGNCLRKGPWRERVMAAGKEKTTIVREYFKQSGLCESTYGLVDLGWFGNLQTYVETLLPAHPPKYGFYLNLRLSPKIVEEGKAAAFIEVVPLEGIDLSTSIILLEILATAPHGSLLGYRRESLKIVPDIENGVDYLKSSEEVEVQHRAILAVASEYKSKGLDHCLGVKILRDQALENFRKFLQKPTLLEAEVYGSVCFVSRQEGGRGIEPGALVCFAEALQILKSGFRMREVCWPQGMIRRNQGWNKLLLEARLALTKLRGYLEKMFVVSERK